MLGAMLSDTVAISLFFATIAASTVILAVLWTADAVIHRPIPIRIPSIYGPIAKLAFHPNRKGRRAFCFLFSGFYRKRVWNPTMGSLVKSKGFDRKRHLQSANMHAACSVLAFAVIALSFYFAHQAMLSGQLEARRACFGMAVVMAAFELAFNAPAIILSRYLYLLTFRRPGLNARQNQGAEAPRSSPSVHSFS